MTDDSKQWSNLAQKKQLKVSWTITNRTTFLELVKPSTNANVSGQDEPRWITYMSYLCNGLWCVGCGGASLVSAIIALILFFVWLGIYVGLNVPEINVNQNYISTNCTAVEAFDNMYKCCTKRCEGCTTCAKQETCAAVQYSAAYNSTTPCCGGSYCCKTCCSKCTRCTKKPCSYYDCNCYCCVSTADQYCNMECKSCWKPSIEFVYTIKDGTMKKTNVSASCDSDYGCVSSFLQNYKLNVSYNCYYNPSDTSQVVFYNGITSWKTGVMWSFAAEAMILAVLACLCGVWSTWSLGFSVYRNKR